MISPLTAVSGLWVAWLASWVIAARFTAATLTRQSTGDQLRHGIFIWVGALLLFDRAASFGPGPLRDPLFPLAPWAGWTAVGVALIGLAFAWWARIHLGRMWSGVVALKAGHRLVRSGPYALTRHPIYTGLLVALAATAVIRDLLAAVVGLSLLIVGILLKVRQEEILLTAHFGAAYRDYQAQVPALFPGLW